MHEDEDNDGKFPNESPVEVRYPRSKQGRAGRPRAVAMAARNHRKAVRTRRMVRVHRGPRDGRAARRPARSARNRQP
jgi:hypothetical protein